MRHAILSMIAALALSAAAPLWAQSGHDRLTVEGILQEELAQGNAKGGVRAQLVPLNRSQLAAGMAGLISAVNYSVGETVAAGDPLLSFDCGALQAQRRYYQARRDSSQINLEVKQRLRELNNVGAQELALSRSELAAAEAELDVIELQLEKCVIHAPFSGTIVRRDVEPHQYVGEGEPVLELLSRDELEVMLVAPSSWLSWLEPGAEFRFQVEEIQRSFAGQVLRLGGRVDPVSQTILVFGKLAESSDLLLPGMSGDINFSRTQ